MDFEDSAEEAAFRQEARTWLEANALTKEEKEGLDFIGIAKWLLLSIKWPQLVRWVQWESEEELVELNTPINKARKIDELINETISDINVIKAIKDRDLNGVYKSWTEKLKHHNMQHINCLTDRQLVSILFDKSSNHVTLEDALNNKVW